MLKLYLGAAAVAIVGGAYWVGLRLGDEKCRTNVAQNAIIVQNKITKATDKINEEILHTAVRDIRDVLRAKYTIAD